MKKNIFHKFEIENKRPIAITSIRKEEGGQRSNIKGCITSKNNKIKKFHPLLVVDEQFKDFFIKKFNVELCKLYYEPFNFKRTGCKGCPYSLDLQYQLDIMKELLPNEYKQCEIIWSPVYDEYRKIGFRLRTNNVNQLTIYDYIEEIK